ncbi:MAG: hypothetical protein ACR2KM_00445 [Gemmatimonadaceae bacterium]
MPSPDGGLREVEVRGAAAIARRSLAFTERAVSGRVALVNEAVGLVVETDGKLHVVLALTVAHGRIAGIDVIVDPSRLLLLTLDVL